MAIVEFQGKIKERAGIEKDHVTNHAKKVGLLTHFSKGENQHGVGEEVSQKRKRVGKKRKKG